MRDGLVNELMRAVSRFAIVGMVGGMGAACSSDAMRFSENPFSSPFSEPRATASVDSNAPASVQPMRRSSVSSAPLAAPTGRVAAAPAYNRPPAAVPAEPTARFANGSAPARDAEPSGVQGLNPSGPSRPASAPKTPAAPRTPQAPARAATPLRVVQAQAAPARVMQAPAPVRVVQAAPAVSRAPTPARAAAPLPVVASASRPAPQPAPKLAVVQAAKPATPVKVAQQQPAAPSKSTAPTRVATAETAKPIKVAAVPAAAPLPAKAPAQPIKVAALPTRPVKTPEPQKVASLAPAKPVPAAPTPIRDPETTAAIPVQPALPAAGDFRWPARGRVIAGFGGTGTNEGINIAVPDGTPVKAAEAGTVAYAGSEVKGYGNLVLIRHENGYVSAYAHNGEIDVKRGQKVTRGQTIAKSGQSGNVTSPQLHFEIRKGSTPVDPMQYLASN